MAAAQKHVCALRFRGYLCSCLTLRTEGYRRRGKRQPSCRKCMPRATGHHPCTQNGDRWLEMQRNVYTVQQTFMIGASQMATARQKWGGQRLGTPTNVTVRQKCGGRRRPFDRKPCSANPSWRCKARRQTKKCYRWSEMLHNT